MFLTAKTTAMVCWLFVGSALFSGVFAILGGQALLEQWVLSLNMTPVQFMILSQAIIFVLGWPLEWTEIIIIFVPIFLPMLKHFNIDPILWGTLVFVNLQAAFLSPPVAMSAFYLKGVAPQARHAQPDLRRHDALHADRHPVHGHHVSLARHDAVAAELPLRRLSTLTRPGCASAGGARSSRKDAIDRYQPHRPDRDRGGARIARGETSSEELVRACLDRIAALEPQVQAWAFLDRERALEQAKAADALRKEGKGVGPLHGVPVGIKDIIDTADMPTENGCRAHKGRQPAADAACVTALRRAGAVIIGKTVTTELATFTPGKTHNPRNLEHTPGGSSSGSAAAVAAGMVPAALGTQTVGSVIRPGAFCGVYGFKPTFGLIPRTGVLTQAHSLDTVGVYGRSVRGPGAARRCAAGP